MYRPCGRILLKVDKLGQGRLERNRKPELRTWMDNESEGDLKKDATLSERAFHINHARRLNAGRGWREDLPIYKKSPVRLFDRRVGRGGVRDPCVPLRNRCLLRSCACQSPDGFHSDVTYSGPHPDLSYPNPSLDHSPYLRLFPDAFPYPSRVPCPGTRIAA